MNPPASKQCDTSQGRTRRAFLRIAIEGFVIVVVLTAIALHLNLPAHYFNRNYREAARRSQCQANLKQLWRAVEDANIPFDIAHLAEINQIIQQQKIECPSSDREHAGYFAEIVKGNVVITEHIANHDTTRMEYTDSPYVHHSIGADGVVVETFGTVAPPPPPKARAR